MAATNPFSWGSNGQKASPSSVKKYAEIAAALAAKSGAPQNVGEGLARVGDALLYNSANSRAAEGEAEGAASRKAVLDALMSNPDPSMTDIAGAMGNEWVASDPGSSAVVQALMAQENQQTQRGFQLDDRNAEWEHQDNDPLRQLQIKAAEKSLAAPPKQWQKLDDNTLFDPASGETKPVEGSGVTQFDGTGLDAQAWNILQSSDPASKEYATAYSIVSQPTQRMVQTQDGMMLVDVPPSLPAWLTPPGAAPVAAADAPASAQLAPSHQGQSQANPSIFGGGVPAAAPMVPVPVPQSSPPAPVSVPAQGAAGTIIPGTQKPPTEAQQRNEMLGTVLTSDLQTINDNFDALSNPKGQMLGMIPGGLGNAWQSEEYQKAANAVSSSVANILYSVSGASANPGETRNQIVNLTPQLGDKPGTIADKKRRLNVFVNAVANASGNQELIKAARDESIRGLDGSASGSPPVISQQDYQSLPSGSSFIAADDPTRTVRVKP